MQFVKIYQTFPDGSGVENLEHRINVVLGNNPDCKIVQAFPCPIEKVGGPEMHLMVVFESVEK